MRAKWISGVVHGHHRAAAQERARMSEEALHTASQRRPRSPLRYSFSSTAAQAAPAASKATWKVSTLSRAAAGKPLRTCSQERPASSLRNSFPVPSARGPLLTEASRQSGSDGCTATALPVAGRQSAGAALPGLAAVAADEHRIRGVGVDPLRGRRADGDLVHVLVQGGGHRLPGAAAVGGAHDAADVDVGVHVGAATGEAAHRRRTSPGGVPFVADGEGGEGFAAPRRLPAFHPVDVGWFRPDQQHQGIRGEEVQAADPVGYAALHALGPVPPEAGDLAVRQGCDTAAVGGRAGDRSFVEHPDRLRFRGRFVRQEYGVFRQYQHRTARGRESRRRTLLSVGWRLRDIRRSRLSRHIYCATMSAIKQGEIPAVPSREVATPGNGEPRWESGCFST